MPQTTKRFPYIVLSLILFILCILIVVLFSSNGFIRGFLGDTVIVILLYSLMQSIKDFDSLLLSVGITLFAYAIEITQYFKIIPLLGFQENFFTRIVFGSIFDPLDLIAYTIGGLLSFFLDRIIIKKI
ncbi:MAG TPA: DUF2809 domain-containing protein [Leptospiraceae bacterium]|nr:DUF2809 domain-containing protein [Leptospiraceae bacterium]HRG76981.1 DUF2809 domain-containing protein [Leptospiraceae bacterium]